MYVVDSNNVTLGERILVEYALRLVDEGRSAAQIAAAVACLLLPAPWVRCST